MSSLRETYEGLREVIGPWIESFDAVDLVEQYRQYFKPPRTRIVLLAESHVFTSDEDMAVRIPDIDGLPGYPRKYARFVYCVGYGEKELTRSPDHPNGDGTPPFWKILYSCNNDITPDEAFAPILRKTKFAQRIRNKVETLRELRDKGVWLVDASIAALYRKGEKPKNIDEAIRISWEMYTRDVVLYTDAEHVICIGKTVASVVENDLVEHFPGRYSVVAQPSAFLTSEEHMANFMHYSSICNYGSGEPLTR